MISPVEKDDLQSEIELGLAKTEAHTAFKLPLNLSTVIAYLLEYIALFDFITDINVTQ